MTDPQQVDHVSEIDDRDVGTFVQDEPGGDGGGDGVEPVRALIDRGAPVITATGVSKRFLTHRRKATSLKERIVKREKKVVDGEFWALRDLNVQIAQGETVGLIGHNGSGKSTTLKLLAGILQPTTGEVHVLGRVSSLLELGAGFAQELTGRDNIYLNASLLGLSRTTVEEMFDDIVEFSELGDRIDDPVKAYSSGMYVKLGFAVAVHVDPDILLVDEVLAVGDEAFQEKCIAKIEEFQAAGKTILVVSHALDQVADLCSRVIWLEHGKQMYDGDPAYAVKQMRRALGTTKKPEDLEQERLEAEVQAVEDAKAAAAAAQAEWDASDHSTPLEEIEIPPLPPSLMMDITSVVVSREPGGESNYVFHPGDPLSVRVEVCVDEQARDVSGEVAVVVMGPHNVPMWVMHGAGGGTVPSVPGTWYVDFRVESISRIMGPYAIAVSIHDTAGGGTIAVRTVEDAFAVPGERALGLLDSHFTVALERGEQHPTPEPAPPVEPTTPTSVYEPLAGVPVETPA